ncbi:lipopolysaccharide biosynthesis protein [Sphingomonas sp. MMS12-HWE2-04]|uniref:lipopolysaccharide biosynthesis protein n=1 Tax=Sphingomonas sp. MMS12-HWE2-04 TaxID=3234199 RepID=UPI00384BAA89
MTQVVRLILTVLSTIVISRLLSPDDYGVMAMAAPVVGFIVLFQDLGLGAATIQARTMSDEASNGLFWINMAASAAIFFALLLCAPLAAWFYGDIRAGYVTAASAAGVLLSGTALQHSALLNRDMRFGALSAIDIANAVVTFIGALIAAYVLRNYWALWIGTMAGTFVQVVLTWAVTPWRPRWKVSLAGIGQMARFGGNLTGFNVLNYIGRNADNVLIAKFAGSIALGLYDRSFKLMMLPLQTINGPLGRLMLPILSRLQDEPERYRRSFLLSVRAILLVATPGITVAVVTSDRLMIFLLGDKWAAAGPIFFWLGLASLFQPVANATGWLFISSGRGREMLRWGIVSTVTTLIAIVVGLQWGVVGVAMSLFVVLVLRTPLLNAYCVQGTSVRTRDLYLVMLEPAIGAVAAALLVHAIGDLMSTAILLCVAMPLAYALGLLAHMLTPAGRALLASMFELATGVVGSAVGRIRRRGAAA